MLLFVFALVAASHALAPTSPPALPSRRMTNTLTSTRLSLSLTRRAALYGLGCTTLLRPAVASEPASEECLSCKLKNALTSGGSTVPVAGNIFESLAPVQKLSLIDVIDVGTEPTQFDPIMKRTLSKYDPEQTRVLVWVQSELVNGVPWCPDTRAAIPLLESALNRARGPQPIVLVTADVVRRDYYMDSYPYRQNPQLELSGVPTLYRWGRNGPVKRLQERQITPSALDALIS